MLVSGWLAVSRQGHSSVSLASTPLAVVTVRACRLGPAVGIGRGGGGRGWRKRFVDRERLGWRSWPPTHLLGDV